MLEFSLFCVSQKSCLLLFIQNGSTALHEAALSEFEGMEKMKILVEYGANVNLPKEVSIYFNTLSIVSERKESNMKD